MALVGANQMVTVCAPDEANAVLDGIEVGVTEAVNGDVVKETFEEIRGHNPEIQIALFNHPDSHILEYPDGWFQP